MYIEKNEKTPDKNLSKSILAFPSSTELTLVFKWHQSQRKFDRANYTPDLTDGKASLKQIDVFLSEVDHEVRKILKEDSKACFFFVLLFISGGFLIYYLHKSNPDQQVGICLVGWFMLLISYVTYAIFRRRRKIRETKAYIKTLIKKYNGTFRAKGLRWIIPEDFPLWIELQKDYLKPCSNFTLSKDESIMKVDIEDTIQSSSSLQRENSESSISESQEIKAIEINQDRKAISYSPPNRIL